MKDLHSKKAIAASLSLTLALGSVPAVALADDADENSEGATSEQSTQAELSFSANGGQFTDGSTGVTVKANEDGSINAPTPTRAGYTFKGWYSQSSMDGIPENYQQYYKLDPSSAKAGSWFAAWEKNAEVQAQSVEVVSFFQGGERDGSSVTTTIDVTADSSVADCVKSFEGYTPTKIVSGAATSEEEVNMTSSLEGITTLYVYYKADEQKTEQNQINVLYAANGGQFVDGNEIMQGVADADGKLRQPPTPTRDGYTFAGWYWHADYSGYTDEQKAADKVDFDQAVTGQTVTMFAQWTKDEVQNETDVLYVANGGKFADGQEVQQGLTDSDGMMRQPMTPTRDGYTFAGWYWVSDLSVLTEEQKEQNKVDFTQPVTKPHVTMYAQWVKNQDEINVLYAANGGQFADGNDTMQGVADSDGVMRQPTAPTREGYTFAGWYWVSDLSGLTDEQKDLNKVDFSQSIAGKDHATIYAQWTKNADQNEIDVLYAANGGQFATGETFQQGLTDSDGVMRQPAEPTREGYTFAGWYWVSDLSGLTDEQKDLNKVDFSQSVAGKEHVTVFAQWAKNQEQNDHAVMYVANGGQFATGETFQQGVTDSDGMMRQPAAPTRDGYTFDGWYWHADYSGYTDEQKAADKVDFSQPVQSDVNIYAQWTKNADTQAEQITVKFVDNFNETESSTEVKKGETVAQPADPTYDGWTFEGWSSTLKDDEGNWEYTPVDFGKAVEDEDQDGVVTYYAFYSENQAAADDTANGEEAAVQEAAGDDADAADEPSIAPQTGDATNVAAVAGIGGIAGLLAAAAALLRRRRSN
ncbi:MAG: InlB B-repeat-containing protein [Eggerthellaceae bacterium]|nr:InlB B-repeat-containing protein [Eggerthellaceae bacterium]